MVTGAEVLCPLPPLEGRQGLGGVQNLFLSQGKIIDQFPPHNFPTTCVKVLLSFCEDLRDFVTQEIRDISLETRNKKRSLHLCTKINFFTYFFVELLSEDLSSTFEIVKNPV